jgi:SAM-dependent methyltransferase
VGRPLEEEAAMKNADELKWEKTNCPWCGTYESDLVFEGPDRLHDLPGMFHLRRCRQCGVLRQDPRLIWEHLSAYYPEDYPAYTYETGETTSALYRRISNYGNVKRRRFVEKFQSGGRLLEVGTGTGAFLRELVKSSKWEVEGIEPSQPASAFAAKTLKVPIHDARLSEVDLEPASFDAIVLWCVLEHLTQPVQDLRYIHSLLKDGGWLFLSVPNYESLETKLFGRFWSGWDLPRHLTIFPRLVLRQILTQIGFSQISERCVSSSYNALGHSLSFWSQSWKSDHPKVHQALFSFYQSWFARLGLFFPLALLDRLNLSTNISFAAQKVFQKS